MKQSPKVSVIVPCFNYGHLLAETLESIRRQTLHDWECIVVDDGSTDTTGDVARTFVSEDKRFSFFQQDNRGLSAARNAGLRIATGKYAQLLDADDLVEDDKLRVHAAFLDEQERFALVYGPMLFFSDLGESRKLSRGRGGVDAAWMTMWPDTDEALLSSLIEGNQFPVSAALFRRAVVSEVGLFDESLRSHEDWDFWLRMAFAGKHFHGLDVPRTATLIREHGGSMTRRAVTMAETRLEVRRRIAKLASSEALQVKNRDCSVYDSCELAAARMASGLWRAGISDYLRGLAVANSKGRALYLLLAQFAPDWLRISWRRLRHKARVWK